MSGEPPDEPVAGSDRLRLDKWLWQARFHKSRTLAAAACASGRIRLNGAPVGKAHQAVKPGDVLTFPLGTHIRIVRVLALGSRRGPASEARELYEDLSPPAEPRAAPAAPPPTAVRDGGSGRPSKAERRALDRLRDRDALAGALRDNPAAGGVEPPPPGVLPIVMFRRLLALFDDAEASAPSPGADPLQRAAAVLLVIAARLDGHMDEGERASIERLLRERLGVTEAAALVEDAEEAAAGSTDFFGVTRVINDRLGPEQRVAVIEMLWEVVYADGAVHDYEANLIRRIAGLLHVSDRDAGEARKRATGGQQE